MATVDNLKAGFGGRQFVMTKTGSAGFVIHPCLNVGTPLNGTIGMPTYQVGGNSFLLQPLILPEALGTIDNIIVNYQGNGSSGDVGVNVGLALWDLSGKLIASTTKTRTIGTDGAMTYSVNWDNVPADCWLGIKHAISGGVGTDTTKLMSATVGTQLPGIFGYDVWNNFFYVGQPMVFDTLATPEPSYDSPTDFEGLVAGGVAVTPIAMGVNWSPA
jgi:hypothetical protein